VIERVVRERVNGEGRAPDLTLQLEEGRGRIAEDYVIRIAEELVENALKFSAAGTPVRVISRRDGANYVLSVTDRGRGMKPEHVAEIGAYMQFERRFYEQQGPGLGLWIAKRLAELHGGSMSIESQCGVGTTIEVRLVCHPS